MVLLERRNMIKLSPEEKFNLTINEASAYFNIGRDKLYELAKENTNRIFPSEVRNMAEVIGEIIFGEDGEYMPEDEEFKNMMNETPDEKSMYVITNKARLFGAAAKNYREKSVDVVCYDELSSFEPDVEKEG